MGLIFKHIYLAKRFYWIGAGLVILSVLGFFWEPLYVMFQVLIGIYFIALLVDSWMLFRVADGISAKRVTPQVFSLGYPNKVTLYVRNNFSFPVKLNLYDEAPVEFQERDIDFRLEGVRFGEERIINYQLRPTHRGIYRFGVINILISSPMALVRRRIQREKDFEIKVYPSIQHMKETEFLMLSSQTLGLKKIRRPGQNFEFEEIKEYVPGDDVRRINWKATARKSELMVNVFQQERSQPIYCVINKGRTMQMPFEGLSLFDYAVNSALAMSNVALRKNDKAGLITFEKTLDSFVLADNKSTQIKKILEQLYKEKTSFDEPNYYDLFSNIRHKLTHRSLLLIYTNFETVSSLTHQLGLLKRLNQSHLVVVVIFENTEIKALLNKPAENLEEVYDIGIAEKFDLEKRLIVKLFRSHGIQCLLTDPKHLTIDVVNKYLELKGRGLI